MEPGHHWPIYNLRLRTPRLEMRVYTEADIPALIEAAQSGIHDPANMPFAVAWTDNPSPEFEREYYRHYWRTRAQCSADEWSLPFLVAVDGDVVGIQDVNAKEFANRRLVASGSWLRQDRQGSGIGREMRFAVLAFAFDSLGAEIAVSESNLDNASSIGVSRALGYEEDGHGRHAPRGEPVDTVRWRLTRERFGELRAGGHYGDWEPVEVDGLDGCLPFLGLSTGD